MVDRTQAALGLAAAIGLGLASRGQAQEPPDNGGPTTGGYGVEGYGEGGYGQ